MKAIETRYRGYRFRSRLEARWAVFFDTLGITWQYEPEGYQLPSGPYLPDFLLPEWNVWAEVKPTAESFDWVQAYELRTTTGHEVLGLIGTPEVRWYPATEPTYEYEYGGETHYVPALNEWLDFGASAAKGRPWWGFMGQEPIADYLSNDGGRFRRAVEASRSSRFEHGESGAG